MKAKITRRALLMSALSLLMCVSMLVGTTFAWFTDSVTSGQNTIAAGNLDVELYYTASADVAADPDSNAWVKVDSNTDVFGYDNWEPGFTKVVYFKVVNEGSLALKYKLAADVYSEKTGINKAGDEFKLSDHLYTAVVPVGSTRDQILAMSGTKLNANFAMGNGSLVAKANENGTDKATAVVGLAIWMPTTVGNEANHNGNAPEIVFGINLLATQYTSEQDSFDANYDQEARYPAISLPGTLPEAGSTEPVEPMLLKTMDGVSTKIPAELVENIDDEYANAQYLQLKHTEPIFDAAAKTVSFGNIDIVDENGNVIELEAMNNTVPITVVVPVGDTFEVGETVIIYHDGEPVASAVVDADKNVKYTITHFCEVVVSAGDGKIDSAVELAAAIAGGGTIMLENDLVLTNQILIPAGTAVTLDLNGKTITSTMTSGRAIVTQGTLTLKNGTIVTNNGVNGVYATGSTAGLTLTDMVINVNGTGTNAEWNHAAIGAANGASVTVNNGTYSAEVGYGLCVMTSGAHIIINDGTFTTGGTTNSAAVRLDSGWASDKIYTSAVINGGTFNAPEGGWAFTATNALGKDIVINGGTFNGKVASHYQDNGVVINGGIFNDKLFEGGGHTDKYQIKGGTFSFDPTKRVAEGCLVINNGDGTYTVGAYKISTGDELVDAIANGMAVELTQDVSLGKIDLTGAIANDVVINANGHKITTTDAYGIEVTAGKNVTISNADVEMTKAGDYITYAAGFKIANGDYAGSTITLKNCTITMANTDWAYAVNMPASVKNLNLVIDNCTLEGAIAVQCWGDNNTVTITNSKLICNYTTNAMYTSYCVALQEDSYNMAENNTFVIDNCEFLYSGIDNFNRQIYAVADVGSENNTITVTNCTYGEKVVAG